MWTGLCEHYNETWVFMRGRKIDQLSDYQPPRQDNVLESYLICWLMRDNWEAPCTCWGYSRDVAPIQSLHNINYLSCLGWYSSLHTGTAVGSVSSSVCVYSMKLSEPCIFRFVCLSLYNRYSSINSNYGGSSNSSGTVSSRGGSSTNSSGDRV
jgi:hypothetical protein